MRRERKIWEIYTGGFFREENVEKEFRTSAAAERWLEKHGYVYYDVYGEYWNTDLCKTARIKMKTVEG